MLSAGCARRARTLALLAIAAAALHVQAATPQIPPRLQFFAALSVDYEKGLPLRAWEHTSRIIQTTLTAWQAGATTQAVVRNPSPTELRQFLQQLPGPADHTFQVVYLAARHTPAGAWQFTRRIHGADAWQNLLQNPPLAHPGRLVILDVCHAGAIVEQPVWREGLAPAATLLASDRLEWTFELDFSNRQPIDLSSRYPAAADWLHRNLPADWNGRLSNLGLAWLLAFLQTPQTPQTIQDWQVFFARCETEAQELQKVLGPHRASRVSQSPPRP